MSPRCLARSIGYTYAMTKLRLTCSTFWVDELLATVPDAALGG